MARTAISHAARGAAGEPAIAPIPRPLDEVRAGWREAFRRVRGETERRAAHLSAEDQIVQSMADASPTKWHRAHVTWFFEQFLLVPNDPGYRIFDPRFPFLFNSYYVAAGPRHARPQRGLITRPNGEDVAGYRAHVDAAVERLIDGCAGGGRGARVLDSGNRSASRAAAPGIADHRHPARLRAESDRSNLRCGLAAAARRHKVRAGFVDVSAGIHSIGHEGEGFCFDNETPRHDELIPDVRIARHLVSNAEWLAFIDAGGYATPSLWLSDGWAAVQAEGWQAPGYWRQQDGAWFTMTLAGLKPVDPAAPVTHVSYYEAEAFARFAGKHLPSEAEWEVAARAGLLADAFGVAWQWTRSAYLPYPGYRAAEGALGEYNGKFMVSQMVLRGSSLATPEGHERVSYRNFFYPPARWQFSGLRLAEFK